MFELSEIKETSSPGWNNPYIRLGAAVLKRAVFDLRTDDPITFFECVHWMVTDAPEWLQLIMDYNDLPGVDMLAMALRGGNE